MRVATRRVRAARGTALCVLFLSLLSLLPLASDAQLISFSSRQYSALESSTSALLPVSCSGPCAAVNCTFTAQGDTASSNGSDFTTSATFIILSADSPRQINIHLVDDDVAEPPETISVDINTCRNSAGQVISPEEGSVLSTSVRVLDDDVTTAKASFTFRQATVSEGEELVVTVEREAFSSIAVDTSYLIQLFSDTATAGVDVTPSSVLVYMNATQRFASATFAVADDERPEVEEALIISLAQADPEPYVAVDSSGATIQLTIPPSDDAYGVFAFHASSLSSEAEEPEGSQQHTAVRFNTTRSGGVFGEVSLSWRIQESDAAIQFTNATGTVLFAEGQGAATITLMIVADDVAEQPQTFTVELLEPSRGRLANSHTRAALAIAPSDYTHGLLVVDTSSPYVAEEVPDQDSFVTVTVLRQSGTSGLVGCLLTVLGGADDFSNANTPVFFQDGQAIATVTLVVSDDDVPELDESFELKLQSATGGAAIDRVSPRASVTILASDNPYGTFAFAFNTSDPIMVVEGKAADGPTLLQLPIARDGGQFGDMTLSFNTTGPHRADVYPSAGSVSVPAGMCCANFTLHVRPDTMQEGAELIPITITDVSGGATLAAGGTDATIIIAANDDTIAFAGEQPAAAREGDTLTFTLVRTGEAAGPASIDIAVSAGATSNTTRVAFADSGGQRRVRVFSVTVLDDTEPEARESIAITLANATGDVVLASTNHTVTVAPSDGGAGVIAFAPDSTNVTVRETTSSGAASLVLLNMTRISPATSSLAATDLADATARWALSAEEGSTSPELEFEATEGTLQWKNGASTATIALRTRDDGVPELAEAYTVTVFDLSAGAALDTTASRSSVVIGANDRPHGLFVLSNTSVGVRATGPMSRELSFAIARGFGLFGEVELAFNATYRLDNGAVPPQDTIFLPTAGDTSTTPATATTAAPAATTSAAAATTDALDSGVVVRSSMDSVTLEDGQDQVAVRVLVRHDAPLVTSASMDIQLLSATIVGAYAGTPSAVLHPAEVGMPSTRSFSLPLAAAVGSLAFDSEGSLDVVIAEPESGVSNASFAVVRESGSYSTVHVAWRLLGVAGASATVADESDFVRSEGVLAIPHGRDSALLHVGVVADEQAEFEEHFQLKLEEVVAGVAFLGAPTTASLTIAANDDPSGVFQWAQDSRGPTHTEEGALLPLYIERLGGALDDVTVTVALRPHNASEQVAVTQLVTFPRGSRSQIVGLQVLDDRVPELETALDVELASVSVDTARLGNYTRSRIVVAESDSPRGVFSFDTSDFAQVIGNYTVVGAGGREPRPNASATVVSLHVQRARGLFGHVSVPFRVVQCSGFDQLAECVADATGEDADADLAPTEGAVAFEPGQEAATVNFTILADDVPEDDELFVVRLLPPSNAQLQANQSRAVVLVFANDEAVGMVNTTLVVTEDDGEVVVAVERSGTHQADIALQYTVQALTPLQGIASGFQVPDNTSVLFGENQTSAFIRIPLIADDEPQPDRQFQVNISRMDNRGDFVIVQPSTLVTIVANDDAAGAFVVHDAFPARLDEDQQEEASFTVQREGGRFGRVRVPWRVANTSSNCRDQLAPSNGSVVFSAGQAFASFALRAVNDDVPEVDQVCEVELLTPEPIDTDVGPARAQDGTAAVTISKNDDYGGVFTFPETLGNLTASEDQGVLLIPVERRVAQLVSSTVAWAIDPEIQDVATQSGVLAFAPGSETQDIVLIFRDDDIPEYPKPFSVHISDPSPGRLGDLASVNVRLSASDQPWGFFAMGQPEFRAREEDGEDTAYSVPVIRQRGQDGTVIVTWAVDGCQRCLEPDDAVDMGDSCDFCTRAEAEGIFPTNGTLVFQPDVPLLNISIVVRDDLLPEITERFTVVLTGTSTEELSAVDGRRDTTIFVVEENDAPFGRFSIAFPAGNSSDSGSGEEDGTATFTRVEETPGALVEAIVTRRQGTFGTAVVDWDVSAVTQLFVVNGPESDVFNTSGTLFFAPGEIEQTLLVAVRDDDIPELDESFNITLSPASRMVQVSQTRGTGTVVIVENDFPYGVVSVSQAAQVVVVSEEDGKARIALTRQRGLFGSITVAWEVLQPGEFAADVSPLEGTVSFAEGEDAAAINLTIHADAVPEVAESLLVEVTRVVEGEAVLASSPDDLQALVVVRASDDPHGTFVFGALSYTFDEPMNGEGDTTAHVAVRRLDGSIGRVAVTVRTFVLSTGPHFASVLDFEPFSNRTLFFEEGETEKQMAVVIRDDTLPELSERFALQLVGVDLLRGEKGPYARQSPRLGNVQQTTITLPENDDARGVFVLDGATADPATLLATVVEGDALNLVVRRDAGAFGDVVVTLSVTPEHCTALSCALPGSDFTSVLAESDAGVSANTTAGAMSVIMAFAEGDVSKRLRLRIADDALPEIDERVRVTLLTASQGRVGAQRSAVAVIPENDDARGVLAFDNATLVTVSEPPGDAGEDPLLLTWKVARQQGTFFNVSVGWSVSGPAGFNASLNRTRGTLRFLPQQESAELVLVVLPDSEPEVTQDLVVRLESMEVEGGARVSASSNERPLRILASDDPFGVFSVPATAWVSVEEAKDVDVVVSRSGGNFGDVRVTYSVRETTVSTLATAQLSFPFNHVPRIVVSELFKAPRQGVNFDVLETLSGVPSVLACQIHCLASNNCASASYGSASGECLLSSSGGDDLVLFPGYTYHERMVDESAAQRYLATADEDFVPRRNLSVTLLEGETEAVLSASVLGDDIPEVWEHFQLTLDHVELLGPYPAPSHIASPRITEQTKRIGTHVIVAANDDPFGNFVIVAANSTAAVYEEANATIVLTIQRQNGSFEEVAVAWEAQLTAETRSDISPTSGSVTFAEGEVVKAVVIGVVDDSEPELDESVSFALTSASNSASFSSQRFTAVIRGNDDASGRFGFAAGYEAVTGSEGAEVVFVVDRTYLFSGPVRVAWVLQGLSPLANSSTDVEAASGDVSFLDGQTSAAIRIQLADDAVPELAEQFRLTLDSVSVPSASLLPSSRTAILTIAANDDVYGVVGWASGSRNLLVRERSRQVSLELERTGGLFVDVSVRVRTRAPTNITGVADAEATADDDYVSVDTVVVIAAGASTASVSVGIIDDTTPELNEAFAVEIVSVEPTSVETPTLPGTPRVDAASAVATITINANDDAAGVFSFATDTLAVTEGALANITIVRSGGSLGEVSMSLIFSDGPGTQGARRGQDYTILSSRVEFADKQTVASVPFKVIDDDRPELEERFLVQLTSLSNGRFGLPGAVTVSIAASDNPSGILRIGSATDITLEEGSTVRNTTIDLFRGPGVFGSVDVTVSVRQRLADGSLAAVQGDITWPSQVSFLANEGIVSVLLGVQPDTIPELTEEFVFEVATQDAALGSPLQATITVPANDNPHGSFGLASVEPVVVDEDVGPLTVRLDVQREGGAFAEQVVEWSLESTTASLLPSPPAPSDVGGDGLVLTPGPALGTRSAAVRVLLHASGDSKAVTAVSDPPLTLLAMAPARDSSDDGDTHTLFALRGVGTPVMAGTISLPLATAMSAGWVTTVDGSPDVAVVCASSSIQQTRVYVYTPAAQAARFALVATLSSFDTACTVLGSGHLLACDATQCALHSVAIRALASPSAEVTAPAATLPLAGVSLLYDITNTTLGAAAESSVVATVATQASQETRLVLLRAGVGGSLALSGTELIVPHAVSHLDLVRDDVLVARASGDETGTGVNANTTVVLVRADMTLDVVFLSEGVGANAAFVFANGTSALWTAFLCAGEAGTSGAGGDDGSMLRVASFPLDAGNGGVSVGKALAQAPAAGFDFLSDAQLASVVVAAWPAGSATFALAIAGEGVEVQLFYLHTIPRGSDVARASGDLVFLPGQRMHPLFITILQDDIPELRENMTLALGGDVTLLKSRDSVSIDILASDTAHGELAFTATSLERVVEEEDEPRQLLLLVTRLFGSIGAVEVGWRVRDVNASAPEQDLQPLSGTLSFASGVNQQAFAMTVLPDALPEDVETFVLELHDATGGAVLSDTRSRATIIVPANDGVHGVFSFTIEGAVDGTVSMAEGTSDVRVTIQRSVGTAGRVRIGLIFLEPPNGAPATFGTDVVNTTAFDGIVFEDGQATAKVLLRIADDDELEVEERLRIALATPVLLDASDLSDPLSPRAENTQVTLVVPANDDASGVVSVSTNATAPVPETIGQVYFHIQRLRGTFGAINVSFSVMGTGANQAIPGIDFTAPTRFVVFGDGESSALVAVNVVNDTDAEEPESFSLRLTSVSGGVPDSPPSLTPLSSARSAQVTIAANDDVGGLFVLSGDIQGGVNVTEGATFTVRVQRTVGFYNDVEVAWRLSGPEPADTEFASEVAGTLFFPAGRVDLATQSFAITVRNDSDPEPEQVFELLLSTMTFGSRVAPAAARTLVRIMPSDASNGVFGFTGALQRAVAEPASGTTPLSLTVERSAGAEGTVGVAWKVVGLCDVLPNGTVVADPSTSCTRTRATSQDFAIPQEGQLSGVLTFEPNVRTLTIPGLALVNDDTAEGKEAFAVELSLPQRIDGRVAAAQSRVDFIIPPNDDGEGVFSIAPISHQVAVEESEQVEVQVVRSLGDFGSAVVNFTVTRVSTAGSGGSDPIADDLGITPSSGAVLFVDGEAGATITIAAHRDGEPEFAEAFVIALASASRGRVQLEAAEAALTVAANEAPYGTFRLLATRVQVEGSSFARVLRLELDRLNGTAARVACAVGVSFELGPDSRSDASKSQLLNSLCAGDASSNCTAVFAAGARSAVVEVPLPGDVLLETGDLFHVALTSATLVDPAEAGAGDATPLVSPAYREQTAEVGVGEANNVIRLAPASLTAEEGDLVSFNVTRGSTRGILSAKWQFMRDGAGQGRGTVADDLSQVSGTLLTATESTVIAVRVTQDAEPEPLETFTLTLSDVDVEGDDSIDVRLSEATLAVLENDDPRGVFSLGAPSTTQAAEGETVSAPIVRSRGRVGAVRIVFSVLDPGAQVAVDAASAPGGSPGHFAVDFTEGQQEQAVDIIVSEDATAERASAVEVRLVSATALSATGVVQPPRVDTTLARVFSVEPSDDPHGVFSLVQAGATLHVSEGVGSASLTIVRQGGALGAVDVEWAVLDVGSSGVIASDLVLSGVPASTQQPQDLGAVAGTARFGPGQSEVAITIPIVDDMLPEPDESFIVALQTAILDTAMTTTAASTGGPQPPADLITPPRISNTKARATVVIDANDNPNGMVTFSGPRFTAQEETGVASLLLEREGARYGPATVRWSAILPDGETGGGGEQGAASLENDLVVPAGNVTIPAGADTATLAIALRNDAVPEQDERFLVALSEPSQGTLLGVLTEATVTIEANDNPSGTVGFPCYDRYGAANADGTRANDVVLSVRRSGGRLGSGSVRVATTAAGTAGTALYDAIDEVLMFGEGQHVVNVTLRTRALDSDQGSQTVVLELSNPSGVQLDTDAATSTVTIFSSQPRAEMLRALQTAACNPNGTDEADLQAIMPEILDGVPATRRSSSRTGVVDAAQLQAIVSVLQSLIPNSGSSAGGAGGESTRALIDSLFAVTLTPGLFGRDVVSFEPLPALLQAYARELLQAQGAGFCPGGSAQSTLSLVQAGPDDPERTGARVLLRSRQSFSGYGESLGEDAGDVEVVFPERFESGTNMTATCGKSTLIAVQQPHWFEPGDIFFTEASSSSSSSSSPSSPSSSSSATSASSSATAASRASLLASAVARVDSAGVLASASASTLPPSAQSGSYRLLQDVVVSVSLPDTAELALVNARNPIMFRVPTLEAARPSGGDTRVDDYVCVWWDAGRKVQSGARAGAEGAWSSQGCVTVVLTSASSSSSSSSSASSPASLAASDANAYVECRCTQPTAFYAVLVVEDEANNLQPVSNVAFVFMIVVFGLVVLAQAACGYEVLAATKQQLLMFSHVVVACLLLLISSLASHTLDADSCATLGVFVHVTLLACLCMWVYSAVHVHRVLTCGRQGLARGVAAAWAAAAAVAVLYIAVHRGALVDSFSGSTYGQVRSDLHFCAIPRVTAGAWAATVLPFLVAAAFAPMIARRVLAPSLEEWGRHEDLFTGRTNAGELAVRTALALLLLLFWAATGVAVLVDEAVGQWLQLAAAVFCCMHVVFFYLLQKTRGASKITSAAEGGLASSSAATITTTGTVLAGGHSRDSSRPTSWRDHRVPGKALRGFDGGEGAGDAWEQEPWARGRGAGRVTFDLDMTGTSIPMSTFVDEPASPPRAYVAGLDEPSTPLQHGHRGPGRGATAVRFADSLPWEQGDGADEKAPRGPGGGAGADDGIFSESYDDLIQALQVAARSPGRSQVQQQPQEHVSSHPHVGGYEHHPYRAVAGDDADGMPAPPAGFGHGYAPAAYDGAGGDVYQQQGQARIDATPSPLSNSEIRRQSIADTHL